YATAAATGMAVLLLIVPVFGTAPSFKPDVVVKGSSLAGWHTLGAADWKIQNGTITGAARPGGQGGWLVLDRSYQAVGLNVFFCGGGGCKSGVLWRAEKTAGGMKGIFVSLAGGDVASSRVTIDADGRKLTREKLRLGGGQMRIAPPLDPNAPG